MDNAGFAGVPGTSHPQGHRPLLHVRTEEKTEGSMNDLAIMARKLAVEHIREDVEAGFSEAHIRSTWHGSGRGQKFLDNNPHLDDGFGAYDVSIGGGYDFDSETGLARKKVKNDKILVTEVCGVKGVWIFNLHQLYQECQKGQVALL